ncbi:MAG TPA: hypothetical protein VN426_01590 [Syntrophomonadaceae bacterium]|nr:hypothetical protein [Syntrophomonadaceae bacterium]
MAEKFRGFINNLAVENQDAINERVKSIARAINQQYWHMKSETRNIHLLGSYGRDTAIKGLENINLLVVLPGDVYKRFEKRGDHGQTALMLEVRESINHISRDTHFTSEGCLMIPLDNNKLEIEIIPGFFTPKKNILYPESHQGWRWAEFNPLREMEAIDEYNFKYGGKIKHLAKMMRAWRRHYQAPIPGMLIDTLVMNFMDDWEGHSTSFAYYGFMCADFLEYLAGLKKEQLVWYAKGSNRKISRSEDFGIQADQAFKKARIALRHEREGDHYNANRVWKTVFGELFPM